MRQEIPIEINPDIYQDKQGNIWMLGVTDGVIRLDYQNEDMIK